MKKLVLFIALFTTAIVFAQSPQKMSYQGVLRNSSSALIISAPVGMKISVLQGSATGIVTYSETQTPTTNDNGLVSLEIGSGTPVLGSFAGINWATGPYFIKTETDPTGGTSYTITGTSQLMSVPYALFSANATAGPQGIQGLKGDTGLTGSQGVIGLTGDKGASGSNGLDGADGARGIAGIDGARGTPGIDGARGTPGINGAQGTPGIDGARGTPGIDGARGTAGIDGAQGAAGISGANGVTGPQGTAGNDGAVGTSGTDGTNGTDGTQGIQGNAGLAGAQGTVGDTGSTGAAGQGGVTQAGLGVSVTGTGTVADPYVVSTKTYAIGLQPELGGYVFRISADGKHGLVAETQNQGTSSWYNAQNLISDPSSHSISGKKFMDWRLPTLFELNEMYNNKSSIGNFLQSYYWSSTEFDSSNAYYFGFGDGDAFNSDKYDTLNVRGVRAF
jgi:hypothetical protein